MTAGKAWWRTRAMRVAVVVGMWGGNKGWPHGESKERSRSVTDRKQVGRKKRSRILPRRVREVRVERS